jgi:DNA end-binding protein Ku
MARSIWSGAISFGLVNVPVKVFTAVRKKDVRFHQLHAKDGVRIQQKRWCPKDEEEVAYDEIVKGYEISPGQYVVIEPDELDALDPEATRTIDIEDFVDLVEIDPLYFDSNYYLVPDERGEKAYRLLLEAMQDAGKVGVARVVMRTKQYLVAVRPVGEALVMTTLNFDDEVVPQKELEGLPGSKQGASDRELRMAQQLIDSLATDWEPSQYKDTYRERVLDLVEQKAEGKEIVTQPEAERPAPVVDLMAALEASLASAKGGGSAKSTKKAAKSSDKDDAEDDDADDKKPAKKAAKSTKKAAKKKAS